MALPLLGAFLSASIGALAKKVLVALGFGTVTYVGLQSAFDAVQGQVISNYGGMSGTSMMLMDLAGSGQALGIILGAISARIGLISLSHLGKVL